jgi:hypothetical protein
MQNRIRLTLVGAAVWLLQSTAAFAGTLPTPSPLALPHIDLARSALALEPGIPAAPVTVTVMQDDFRAPAGVETSAVHYKPAPVPRYEGLPGRPFVSQLHGGFFNASSDNTAPFVIGMRAGPMVDQRLQLGIDVDWIHQTKTLSNILSTSQGPGGVPVSVKEDSARALLNQAHIMAFTEISGWGLLGFVPYFGLGGGYEFLVLSSDNFVTGQSRQADFSGWAWQAWGGVGIPLGKRTRLKGEVYVNQAELGKTVTDVNGVTERQTVDMNGVGLRIGIAWGYRAKTVSAD